MKRKIITLFLALVAIVGSISASFTQVDGIYYDFDKTNRTASVTYKGSPGSYDDYWYVYKGNITIPETVTYQGITYTVTSIGSSAFNGCKDLLSVIIPNSVTKIDAYAFQSCRNLWCVTLGGSVSYIDTFAFDGTSVCTVISYAPFPPQGIEGMNCGTCYWWSPQFSMYLPNATIRDRYAYDVSWGNGVVYEHRESYCYTIGSMPVRSCSDAATAALSVSKSNETFNNDATYTVAGYVIEISYSWSNGTMSFWIADAANGGKVIQAYKCAIEDPYEAVEVGEFVAVTGKLTKYGKTPEFAAGCTVYRTHYKAEDYEDEDLEPTPIQDRYVVLAQRDASSNWFYMTSDLGTAYNKRYQAVDAGTSVLTSVNSSNLDSKYYWQMENNIKLKTDAGYSTWESGNSANLDATGYDLTIQQLGGNVYTFSFMDGGDIRYLSLNKTAGNDYFAYYKSTNQIYKLTLIKEGENVTNENIDIPQSQAPHSATKILRNGQILILRGDKTYTVTGMEVK